MDKVNTLHQINGGRVGDLPESLAMSSLDGEGGTLSLTSLTSVVIAKTGG